MPRCVSVHCLGNSHNSFSELICSPLFSKHAKSSEMSTGVNEDIIVYSCFYIVYTESHVQGTYLYNICFYCPLRLD